MLVFIVLNTLDLIKRGTTPLAQRARAASRILEQQVGTNPRIKVQRDEAYVLWDDIPFLLAKEGKGGENGNAEGEKESVLMLPENTPEWLRRTVACARWELDRVSSDTDEQPGSNNTNVDNTTNVGTNTTADNFNTNTNTYNDPNVYLGTNVYADLDLDNIVPDFYFDRLIHFLTMNPALQTELASLSPLLSALTELGKCLCDKNSVPELDPAEATVCQQTASNVLQRCAAHFATVMH